MRPRILARCVESGAAAALSRGSHPYPRPSPVDYERIEAIVRTVAEEVYQRRWSMAHQLRSASAADSARFVLQNIPLHLAKSHYELRRDAVIAAPADGLFLEFGVWQGNWLRQMAALREDALLRVRSFEGLPEPWSVYAGRRPSTWAAACPICRPTSSS